MILCWIKLNNKLYVTFDNSLFEYDGNTVRKVLTGPERIISVSKDNEDRIWIGYFNQGAERYDILKLNDSTFVFTTIGNGFILLNRNTWQLKEHGMKNKFISDYIQVKFDQCKLRNAMETFHDLDCIIH